LEKEESLLQYFLYRRGRSIRLGPFNYRSEATIERTFIIQQPDSEASSLPRALTIDLLSKGEHLDSEASSLRSFTRSPVKDFIPKTPETRLLKESYPTERSFGPFFSLAFQSIYVFLESVDRSQRDWRNVACWGSSSPIVRQSAQPLGTGKIKQPVNTGFGRSVPV